MGENFEHSGFMVGFWFGLVDGAGVCMCGGLMLGKGGRRREEGAEIEAEDLRRDCLVKYSFLTWEN